MGLQAFQYGWPLIYFLNLMWQWTANPKSSQRPLNSWIQTLDFVATSNYRDGGSFNTDTVYTGAYISKRSGGPLWGNFLLLPPGWKGEVPSGKFDRVLQCEQKWIFALIRLAPLHFHELHAGAKSAARE